MFQDFDQTHYILIILENPVARHPVTCHGVTGAFLAEALKKQFGSVQLRPARKVFGPSRDPGQAQNKYTAKTRLRGHTERTPVSQIDRHTPKAQA